MPNNKQIAQLSLSQNEVTENRAQTPVGRKSNSGIWDLDGKSCRVNKRTEVQRQTF